VWCGALGHIEPLFDFWSSDMNVQVLEIEHGVGRAGDLLVGLDNVFDLVLDKVVEAVIGTIYRLFLPNYLPLAGCSAFS
jgi:hypothetical protein